MKKVLIRIAASLALLVLLAGAAFAYASHRAGSTLGHSYAAHAVDFPVPMPMSPDEIPEGEDPDAFALASAIERGRHLVRARYACADCHGEDLSGGVMIDDPAMGRLLGPNLTSGKCSIVSDYTPSDWVHLVLRCLRPAG